MGKRKKKVYLLLGSNLGDRIENLCKAREKLRIRVDKKMKVSSVYLSDAWGNSLQANFFNQAVSIETSLTPQALLKTVLEIEKSLGREQGKESEDREIKWDKRTIDIDILMYEKEILCEPNLTLPHSFMPWRRFLLKPLAEIAGDVVHPILHRTIDQMLSICVDSLKVRRFNPKKHISNTEMAEKENDINSTTDKS